MADSKKFGDAWVFWPIACVTGAIHAQPALANDAQRGVRILTCTSLAEPGFIFFDERGALDAPEQIPCGSVRAQDFLPEGTGRLMLGHVYRDGAFDSRWAS